MKTYRQSEFMIAAVINCNQLGCIPWGDSLNLPDCWETWRGVVSFWRPWVGYTLKDGSVAGHLELIDSYGLTGIALLQEKYPIVIPRRYS